MKSQILIASAVTLAALASTSQADQPKAVHMGMEKLRQQAFARCQGPYQKPVVPKVPALDPPEQGGIEAVGMTYQEELVVKSPNYLDRDGFYFLSKPRAALNTLPMDVFVSRENNGVYEQLTWDTVPPNFSHSLIQPPITMDQIPPEARILTEVIIGHRAPDGGYPQMFDLRSGSYVRFQGYSHGPGASLRLGAHKLWSLSEGYSDKTEFGNGDFNATEDFPVLRSMYTAIKDPSTASALVLLESDLFCAALNLDMKEGSDPSITVDGYWYTRRDFQWKADPNTAFVAYSSMFWMDERNTPDYGADEAHDSDTFRVKYADESQKMIKISIPAEEGRLRLHDLSDDANTIKEWTLDNEDRDPEHYKHFAPYLHDNYPTRAGYKVEVLDSSIKTGVRLYAHYTNGEYMDNIVAASTIRQDIPKAIRVEDYVRFKYRTTAFIKK